MKLFQCKSWILTIAKDVVLFCILQLCVLLVVLLIASAAVEHPLDIIAFQDWISASRYGWLVWRLIGYCLLGGMIWKISRAQGFREEHRYPLIRMSLVSAAFILLCEYVLLISERSEQ